MEIDVRWRRAAGWLVAAAAGVAAGVAAISLAESAARHTLTATLGGYAPTYAAELSILGHAELPDRVAVDDPVYLLLLAAERRWEQANPRVRDVGTLRRTPEGGYIHLVDAESDFNQNGAIDTGWEGRIPPGLDAGTVPAAAEAAFRGEATVDLEVRSDARGELVTAWAPVRGPDGRVEAAVRVALDAAPVRRSLLAARVGAGGAVALVWVLLALAWERRSLRVDADTRVRHAALVADQSETARASAASAVERAAGRVHALLDRLPVPAAVRNGERVRPNRALAAELGVPIDSVEDFFAAAFGAHASMVRRFYEADRAAGFPEARRLGLGAAARATRWQVTEDAGTELWVFSDADPAGTHAGGDAASAPVQAMPVAAAVWDAGDRLVAFNERYRALVAPSVGRLEPGMTHEELLDEVVSAGGQWPSGLGQTEWLELRRALHAGLQGAGEERVLGGWIQLASARLPDGGTLHLAAEITEQKRVQAELRTAKELAEARARARTEFLANVSHEIRTPMTAILGYVELLAEESLPEAERLAHLATVRRNSAHLMEILNDILDLARIEAGRVHPEPAEVDTAGLVGGVVELFEPRAAEKGIGLVAACAGPVPSRFVGDPVRVRQVLLNLVSNAMKFTDRGEVRVEVAAPSDGLLQLRVIDTGVGIDPALLDELFEPFTQTEAGRAVGGTGLGLAISRRLADMLGGSLQAASTPGVGTTLTFTFSAGPVADSRAIEVLERAPARPAPVTTAPTVTGRVLVVDDGRDNQLLLTALLRKAGAEVEVADDGRVAVDRVLAEWRARRSFDLVLMDMQMPGMDGYAATSQLRAEGYRGPVVAVTGNALPGDRERCLAAGADGYLTKPIDRIELLTTVAAILDVPEVAADPLPEPEDPLLAELTERFIEDLPAGVARLFDLVARSEIAEARVLAGELAGSAQEFGLPGVARLARRVAEGLGDPERGVRLRVRLLELGAAVARVRTLAVSPRLVPA